MHPTTRDGLKQVLLAMASLVVPAALTLASVISPGTLQISSPNPSPHGYTISLLLFIVPDILLVLWLLKHPEAEMEQKAFWATVLGVVLMGCVLDFFFAYAFFYYLDTGATLGIRLPAFAFGKGWLSDVLPIEEFGFYGFGAFFMAGVYVAVDLMLAPGKKSHVQEQALARAGKRLWQFHPGSVLIGLALIGLALAYRTWIAPGGFPGYFIFLVCIGVVPSALLYPVAAPVLNWTAFTVMFVTLQLVSLLWEASVAVPYNWWNYHHEQMVGVFIGAWANLPLEAVMMWILSGWAVSIVYEALRVFFHRQALPASPGP